jgi:hypothetical protein
MLTKDQLRALRPDRQPVEVSVPGWPDSVLLRYPTFGEWHQLLMLNQATPNSPVPAENIAKTIGICLGNPDGSRMLSDAEAMELLRQDPTPVKHLYAQCIQQNLKPDNAVEAAEKN